MTSTAIPLDRKVLRRLNAAEGYCSLEMFDHAARELRAVEDVCQGQFEFHALRSELLRAQSCWAEALQDIQICLKERPEELDLLMGAAWCYKRTGGLPEAIATMHDAYRAHPQVAIVQYNLSCYYALAQRPAQAIIWLKRALRMQPSLRQLIADETDFDPIRELPEFQKLLEITV